MPRPEYLAITKNNNVSQDVINQLGGIEDTVKPMQESLRQNELRPYEYIQNYAREIERM
jgi:hypothetical protein